MARSILRQIGSVSLSAFLVVAVAMAVAMALTACAPKDVELPSRSGGSGDAKASSANLIGKELELSRRAILQLTYARRALDIAMHMQVPTRVSMQPQNKVDVGCRSLRKLSPEVSRSFDTSTEKFLVSYNKCQEEMEGAETATAEITGSERYTVSYNKLYPKEGDADFTLGTASSIVVEGSDISLSFIMKSHKNNRIRVSRDVSLNAELMAANETTWTYKVWSNLSDVYDFDVKFERRMGTISAWISEAQMVVDKKTRTVIAVSAPRLGVKIQDQAFEKSDYRGSSLKTGARAYAELNLSAKGALKLASSNCQAPSGEFVAKPKDDAEISISSAEGQLKISSVEATKSASICKSESQDPLFLEEIESLFF